MAAVTQEYGAYTSLSTTSLNNLNPSATAGWQSARVSNISTKAQDYEIVVKLPTQATAAANDKAVYVFISPAVTTDGGTTWLTGDGGTTTLPGGTEGTYTTGGVTANNNLDLARVMYYVATGQTMQAVFRLSDVYGTMPDGFQVIINNYSGATLSSGTSVGYRSISSAVA